METCRLPERCKPLIKPVFDAFYRLGTVPNIQSLHQAILDGGFAGDVSTSHSLVTLLMSMMRDGTVIHNSDGSMKLKEGKS